MARWRVEGWPEAQMPDTPAKLAEHYRRLAAEEVAMAKLALTNEARARHYAKAADIGSWRMQRRGGRSDGPLARREEAEKELIELHPTACPSAEYLMPGFLAPH